MAECMECQGCSCGGCELSSQEVFSLPLDDDCFDGPTSGYYQWLLSLTGFGFTKAGNITKTYGNLLGVLYRKEFYALIPNDDNRGTDGIALREEYLHIITDRKAQLGPSSVAFDSFVYKPNTRLHTVLERIDGIDLVPQGPCRVLEMIVALTNRLVFELDDLEHGNVFRPIFWELIRNLGFDSYDDDSLTPQKLAEIHKKVEKFLERRYKKNGKGGLFPLKKGLEVGTDGKKSIVGSQDQTKIEIAYQMDAYIRENFR